MCKPGEETGTTKVAVKDPIELVVTIAGTVVRVTPSYLRVILDVAA